MFKKKLIMVLAAAMAFSIAVTGCGSNDGSSTGSTSDSSDAGNVSSESSGGSADDSAGGSADAGGGAYRVATVRWADWGEFYHEGFVDDAAAEVGIEIAWDTILNSDWGDRKAVLLAGGDLPDAFLGSICFGEGDILNSVGTFIPLEDYIDEYMPNFKAILESDPTMKALAYSADGHIWGLPSKKPCRPTVANQVFINQTWLDNLGLSMPSTYEEFVDVLRAFKEQDANGNGDPTDEIPYGEGYADSVMFFCLPFGTTIGADNTNLMAVKNGTPIFLPVQEEYKEALAWMHDCMAEGLVDTEIFTQDDSTRDGKLMSETPIVGVAPGWTADSTFGANADQYVALPALTGPDGNAYISSDPEHWNYTRCEFMVTTACENPGPLLAWADQFYTEDASIQTFYGSFGLAVEKNDDGTYTVLEPNDGNSADTFAWINSLRDFGPKYVAEGFNDKVIYAGENGDASKLALDEQMKQYAREAYPNVSYTVEQTERLGDIYTDIGSYVTSMQAEWVTNGGVEDGWDSYIAMLNQMGYEEFIQIEIDAYNTYKANQ